MAPKSADEMLFFVAKLKTTPPVFTAASPFPIFLKNFKMQ